VGLFSVAHTEGNIFDLSETSEDCSKESYSSQGQ